jgi:hypothetical protein
LPVTLETFTAAAQRGEEPPYLTPLLRALWLDRAGDWKRAHDLAGEIDTADGARIHAYLHRKEGDLDNARYWYRQAGQKPFEGSLADEWSGLASDYLAGGGGGE